MGRWALIGVFALVLYLYIGPAVSWIETYREAGRQREAVAELRAENQRLRERKAGAHRAAARSSARRAGSAWSRPASAPTSSSSAPADRPVSILGGCRTRPHGSSGRKGLRRLDDAFPEQAPTLERVTRAVHGELRRRLGGPFTLDELADLYDEGTGWCTDLAVEVAPDEPFAWDARIVADAAFGRYQRAATDFAGGRRVG